MKRGTVRSRPAIVATTAVLTPLVVLLAVALFSWVGQSVNAQPAAVLLLHASPDGSDYTGNPYCPDTVWTGTKKPVVNPWHDCNNITSQNHVIRTEGWDLMSTVITWNVENFSGAVATIQVQGWCQALDEVTSRPDWDTANNSEQCLVIHSSTPGETRVTLTYDDDGVISIAGPVVKEWDSLVDSVILKYGDLEKVKVYYDVDGDTVIGTSEYKELYLPKDVNGDGVRDAADEHLLDRQGAWQDHGVVYDEALKRVKALPPVQISEIVHGEHEVLIDSVSVITHQPTEGALVLAEIESERNCTFFTDSLGTVNLGDTIQATSDNLGRLTVYLDTICEEQAIIHFYAQYPNLPGSVREGLHEWIGINWMTMEMAKQPQIRWAGEEIILAKRWALDNEYYPNAGEPVCPFATIGGAVYSDEDGDPDGLMDTVVTHHVNYILLAPGLGALEGGYIDINGDGVLDTLSFMGQSEAIGHIDDRCISKFLAGSENPGQQDIAAKLMEDTYYCEPYSMTPGEIYWDSVAGAWWCDYDGMHYAPATLQSSALMNKHAFLVWYLKIYQVKLTNVDGARAYHNAGPWSFGDGEDTEEDTLNVSADTLLRVKVKGWFFSEHKSSRPDMCIDMDGDGDEAGSPPGEPYPAVVPEGCPDPNDEMLENGHWVLPDDLPILAGPDAIHTRPTWDVMSEPEAAKTIAIGPKSTLDSHDAVLRAWVGRKTVVPDGAISEADAIMPPLKIRASIADGDAGFLKEALKSVIYASTNDYHSIMIPADPEIPAVVNNGGYDWASWSMPSCSDADMDGVCDVVDLCPADFDPTNGDLDSNGVGDVCDADADGDTILDDGDGSGVIGDAPCVNGDTTDCDDNCRLTANATQADADADGVGTACDQDDLVAGTPATDLDSDGDAVLDANDNCPTKSNATQTDTDEDGYGDACDANPGVPYYLAPPVPYPFWTITGQTGAPFPEYIEFYTDNRGEGMFFANGDYNLSFDGCRTDPISGAPDCSPGDVVGMSTMTVIGDYPYFRKYSAVLSNPVIKTWEWGGFKRVTAVAIDATHTAIIAHLKDRDGFCKWEVKSDPTATSGVTFSPSLNPVQGEEVEFILNLPVGSIIDVSPDALYSAPHTPLGRARAIGLEDGVIVNPSEAVALAEDGRVLSYYGEARPVYQEDECQAWVVIEHPLGEIPNISVLFHDPEGDINRHWPPTELVVRLVQGWNDSCYVGPEQPVEDAVADIVDDVVAIFRLRNEGWERWFPDRPDVSNMDTFYPYDQLFILMTASADWPQEITAPPTSVNLVQGWNSVCYAGADKATEEATADIAGDLSILLTYGSDQIWRRYMPGLDWANNITTLDQFTSVLMLVTAEGGTTWVFDPPAIPAQLGLVAPSTPEPAPADLNLPASLSLEEFCGPVFPGTYYGTVTVGGQPAPDGTTIWAIIDGIIWGSTTTSGGRYVFEVPPTMPAFPPCFGGGTLTFQAEGASCQESPQWAAGPQDLDLHCLSGPVGDVDCDGDIDAVDALFILQYVVRLREGSGQCPPPEGHLYLPAANVDCDGDVDAVDALFVLQHVVGLRPELCPAEPGISGSWLLYMTPEGEGESGPDCVYLHQQGSHIYYSIWQHEYAISVSGPITGTELELSGRGVYYGDDIYFSASATTDGRTITGSYSYTGAHTESGTWRAEKGACKKAKGWVRTSNLQNQGYELVFYVWDLIPEGIVFTSADVAGPHIGTISLDSGGPTEYHPWEATVRLGETMPTPGDVYTFTVDYSDGTSESVTASVRETFVGFPTAISPADGEVVDTLTPTFSWEAPACACQGYYRVWVLDSEGNDMWSLYVPAETTSVVYNSDGTGTPLSAGETYEWRLIAYDKPISGGPDNNTWVLTGFTVQAGMP